MDIVYLCFLIFVSATLLSADLFSQGTECTSNATCELDTLCLPGVDNIKRCICEGNKFRTNKNKCNFIIDLRVYNIKVDKVTPTSVKLNWTSDYVQGLAVTYNVSYNGTYQLGDENGVTVDNLRPDTHYKFTVQVIISDKSTHELKYGPKINYNVRTSASRTSTKPLVTMETITSTLSTSSSELKSKRTPDIEMSMTSCRDSISLKVFLLVTISLCSLLAAAIVIIVILMRSKWRRKKRIENVYDTTKKCDLETHQYCDLSVSYGKKCTNNATCILDDTVCLPGVDNDKRCLCEDNKFRTSKKKCNFISDLRVYNIKADKTTPTSIKLNWTSNYVQGLSAIYNVSYNNSYQLGDENGVTVDNLRPDTLYKFTFQVIISDKHLGNEPTYGPSITYSARTSAMVTVSSSSASHTTQSHVDSTDLEIESDSNSLNKTVANMTEPGAKETGINPIIIIVVGILVVIALLTAILLFILLRRHKRNQATKRGTEHTNNHTDINSFQRLSQASDRNNKNDHEHLRKPQTAQETVKQKTNKDKDLSPSKEANANIYNDTNCLLLVSSKNEDRTSGASTAANDVVAVGDAVATDSVYSHLSHYHTQKRTETENIYNV